MVGPTAQVSITLTRRIQDPDGSSSNENYSGGGSSVRVPDKERVKIYLEDGFKRINSLEDQQIEDGIFQLNVASNDSRLKQIPLGKYRGKSFFLAVDMFALPFYDGDSRSDSPRRLPENQEEVLADYLRLIQPFREPLKLGGSEIRDSYQLGRVFYRIEEAERRYYTNFPLVITKDGHEPWLTLRFQDWDEDGSEYGETGYCDEPPNLEGA